MDENAELQKFKWIIAAGFFFLLSAYIFFKEFKYMIWSRMVEAEFMRVFEVKGGRRSSPKWAVEYTFTDSDGNRHSERDDPPLSWTPATETVAVQYFLNGHDSSRILRNSQQSFIWIFLGSLAVMVGTLYRLFQEANQPIVRMGRHR